jgi:hypothetical protein
MVTGRQLLKGAIAHSFLLAVNFCVLLGVIVSIPIVIDPINSQPFLNILLLDYMILHTLFLLSIQIGVQILEITRKKLPSLLVLYYFRFGDQETIPEDILDPIKSKLAVIIILLILSGGFVIYPFFAVLGFSILLVRLPIIFLNPTSIITFFDIFLNLIPPLTLLFVLVIVLSIVLVEFRRQ